MENFYDNSGLIGVFEPKCKIRFLSDPHPQEDYIAISTKEYQELLASSMKLCAFLQQKGTNGGGVDNWEWYGESLHDFKKELPDSYGDAFWQWVEHIKSDDETCEDYVDDMTINDFAGFEVNMML